MMLLLIVFLQALKVRRQRSEVRNIKEFQRELFRAETSFLLYAVTSFMEMKPFALNKNLFSSMLNNLVLDGHHLP